ncbi:MAG: putative thiol-disulfide oxidoreductase [Mycobacterium sp.]|jgi:hypothetical protein|nr:putative thiol-disulfide oxidoreductase [Mycobacterium sp.]
MAPPSNPYKWLRWIERARREHGWPTTFGRTSQPSAREGYRAMAHSPEGTQQPQGQMGMAGTSVSGTAAPQTAPLLLCDGVCGFCNRTVQTILRFDPDGTLRFAARASDGIRTRVYGFAGRCLATQPHSHEAPPCQGRHSQT